MKSAIVEPGNWTELLRPARRAQPAARADMPGRVEEGRCKVQGAGAEADAGAEAGRQAGRPASRGSCAE